MKRLGAFAVTFLVVSSCTPKPAPTGQLTLTIAGVPQGQAAAVLLTGPGGYSQVFSSSQTISGLALGSYVVHAAPVVANAPIVSTIYDGVASGSPATVTAGATAAAAATYALRPGTGMLWFMGSDTHQILGFSASPGADGGTLAQTVVLDAGTFSDGGLFFATPEGCAFDAKGNLWVSGYDSQSVVAFSAAQLTQSGSPTPLASFTSPLSDGGNLLFETEGLSFDSQGNLWVAAAGHRAVVKYSAAQLADAGLDETLMPVAILDTYVFDGGLPDAGSIESIAFAYDPAFDSTGALWIGSSGRIAKFAHPQNLTGESATPPDVLIFATVMPGGVLSLDGVQGLAFGSTGDLWAANWNSHTLERYASPSTLSGVVGVVPAAQISDDAGVEMGTLAFDNAGNAWVAHGANTPNNVIYRLPSLAGSTGVQTVLPTSILNGLPYGDLSKVCFNPPPPSVPIYR